MEAAVRLREFFGLINFNFWGKSGRCPSTCMNWTRLQVEDQVVSLCVRRRMIEYNRRTLWWTEKIWSCTTLRTCCCGHCYRRRTYICFIPLWLSLEFNCGRVETAGDCEMMELENKTNWFLKSWASHLHQRNRCQSSLLLKSTWNRLRSIQVIRLL